MQNKGKEFESDFKNSCKNDESLYVFRLRDNPASFKRYETVFTHDNPCDFFIYKTINSDHTGMFCACELKSTQFTSMSFERSKDDNPGMIHYHQILSLIDIKKHGALAGFLFNFRNAVNETSITYYLDIDDFSKFVGETTKKSINLADIITYNGILVLGEKKRVHYTYDVNKMIDAIYQYAQNK